MNVMSYELSSAVAGALAMALAIVRWGPAGGFRLPMVIRVRLSLRLTLSDRDGEESER
jgi:hypothetical protein